MSLGIALVPLMFFFMFLGVNVAFGIGMAVVSGVVFWNEIPMMIISSSIIRALTATHI